MSAKSNVPSTVFNRKPVREGKDYVQVVIANPRHGLVGWASDENGVFHEYTFCDRWGHKGWVTTEKYKELKETDKAPRRQMYYLNPGLLKRRIQAVRLIRPVNRAWMLV
ncbi:hypothetical protein EB052_01725 [bacterium]|nr:hypothetical protein [bacterium]